MLRRALATYANPSSQLTRTNSSLPRPSKYCAGGLPVTGSRGNPASTHALNPFRTMGPFTRRSE
jgi:hypothetical protein